MAKMLIRRFDPADTNAVFDLHRRALFHVGAPGPTGEWEDDLRDVSKAYLSSGGEFLVGLIGRDLVVMGALERIDSTRAEIKRMRVDPRLQRQGLGRELLRALEESALALGVVDLELETTVVQEGAQRFYEVAGFMTSGTGYAHGYEVVRYQKRLVLPRDA